MGRVRRVPTVCRDCSKTYTKTLSGALSCPACVSRKIRERNKSYVREVREQGSCVVCGIADPVVLQFHHVDPTTKWRGTRHRGTPNGAAGVSGLLGKVTGINKLKAEIAKCVLVCANCHLRLEAGVVALGPECAIKLGLTADDDEDEEEPEPWDAPEPWG